MLIPYNTDAPLYHPPFATGAMIAANVAAFLGLLWLESQISEGLFEQIHDQLILQFGRGLRPWQWVTSNFMHANFLHLLGNMFCLWGFGLVVEGKIGWWRFLLIYFGIGVGQCAVEQTMMLLSSQGGSLGASSIIYGLMAICLIWAPRNEMNCVLLFGFRPIMFDVTLYSLVIFSLLMEIGMQLFTGLSLTSQVLHLMGASAGFAVAIVMLRRGYVDCEGWDLFNVWNGTETSTRDNLNAEADKLLNSVHAKRLAGTSAESAVATSRAVVTPGIGPRPRTFAQPQTAGQTVAPFPNGPPVPEAVADPKLVAMRQALADGNPTLAFAEFQDLASDPLYWPLPESELLKAIVSFHERKEWLQAIPAMEEYLRHFKQRDTQVRLKLAQILLEFAKRSEDALRVLDPLQPADLPEKDGQRVVALRKRAESKSPSRGE